MNQAFEYLYLRRPALDYISPPVCEALFSASGGPVIILNPLTPQSFPTGLILGGSGNFILNWDAYPGALCYSVYKADTSDPFGSYTIVAECIPNPPFDITPFGTGCYRISAITTDGETPLSLPACREVPTGGAPIVQTDDATFVLSTSARLNGHVNPNGADTTRFFEWGFDTLYGNVTPNVGIGSGFASLPISADIGSLSPSTTYHFRAVGVNANGTVQGTDHSFVTQGPSTFWDLAWTIIDEAFGGGDGTIIKDLEPGSFSVRTFGVSSNIGANTFGEYYGVQAYTGLGQNLHLHLDVTTALNVQLNTIQVWLNGTAPSFSDGTLLLQVPGTDASTAGSYDYDFAVPATVAGNIAVTLSLGVVIQPAGDCTWFGTLS